MILKETDYIDNDYYAGNYQLFRIVGLWPYQTSVKELIYTCVINIVVTIALFFQIYILLMSELQIDIIVQYLETILPTLCFGSCYYNLLWNTAIMKKIQYRMKCDWDEIENKPEFEILKKYASISKLYTTIIKISFYLYIAFLICPSQFRMIQFNLGMINETELTLPIDYKYFVTNSFTYYFANFFICICIIVICTIGIANYTMFIAIIQHVCALFDIIVWRVKERFKAKLYYNYGSCSNVKEKEWIIDIIKSYNSSMEFVTLIKLFYETILLLELFYALIFIMVDYFYILFYTLNTSEKITKFFYVIGSIFVIYTYIYIGQKLINHHMNLHINLCQIPFYSLSLNTRKMFFFLIMNSTRPCFISVNGILSASHTTFMKCMRLSFSFATLFYNLG